MVETWQNYFDAIFCLNLAKREDRRNRMLEQFEVYGIGAKFWESYYHEKGYFGLVVTMKHLFEYCLDKGYEKILIFEDDAKIMHPPDEFHRYMEASVNDLKNVHWDLFYLGLQHVKRFRRWVTPNLLPVECGYSTHATAYSKRAMEFVVSRHIDEPIDNWLVREFQPQNTSYCTYPLLVTQFDGYSDIGNDHCNWNHYITTSYHKHLKDIMQFRNNG